MAHEASGNWGIRTNLSRNGGLTWSVVSLLGESEAVVNCMDCDQFGQAFCCKFYVKCWAISSNSMKGIDQIGSLNLDTTVKVLRLQCCMKARIGENKNTRKLIFNYFAQIKKIKGLELYASSKTVVKLKWNEQNLHTFLVISVWFNHYLIDVYVCLLRLSGMKHSQWPQGTWNDWGSPPVKYSTALFWKMKDFVQRTIFYWFWKLWELFQGSIAH